MSFTRWLRNLRPAFAPGQVGRKHRQRSLRAATHRPDLETLEDRCLPSFLGPVNYPVGSSTSSLAAADFNGDTRLDLVVVNVQNSNASVFLGNANGTFQPALNSPSARADSCAVGDFNADGKLDLATVTSNASTVGVLLGNGNGTFQAPTSTSIGWTPSSVAVGDFNGDGKLDLGVTSSLYVVDGYHLYWAYGYGDYYVPYGHSEGRADVLLGNGDGSLSAPNSTALDVGRPFFGAVADFDGDGKLDFATANLGSGTVSVLLGDGAGSLRPPTNFSTGSTSTASVAAGDVNGDGKLDLVTTNIWSDHSVSVLQGDGLGSFGPAQTYATDDIPTSVVLGDFNRDGRPDLITANEGSANVSVLFGTGLGAFSPQRNFATDSSPRTVVAGDFNRDGWLDAATVNYSPANTISVLINDQNWPPADAPTVSINDVTVTEGNTGTVNATFTVSLSAVYYQDVTVHFATANGSAAAGGDYAAASGDVIIPAGQTSRTITVAVTGDRLAEPDETFAVNLSAATNGLIVDSQGLGTILDNEPRISISDVARSEGAKGQTTLFTFTVTLSTAYDQAVTMSYATANGTAKTSDNDYIARTGTLTFAPGETTKTITIEVKGDSKKESNETFYLDLFDNSSNSLFTKNRGIGTIRNDD